MRVWTKLPDEDADQAALAKAQKLTSQGTWPGAAEAQRKVEASIENHKAARARYASIASDIVTVVRSERPAFPSDENRSRTAVLVAGVAFYEAAFLGYVDDGLCNDWKWRHPMTTGPGASTLDEVKQRMGILKAGSCDGGWAYSMWGIHPFDFSWREGMVLLDDGREWSFASYVHDGQDRPITLGKDMIADRRVAARMALHMLRRALVSPGPATSAATRARPSPAGRGLFARTSPPTGRPSIRSCRRTDSNPRHHGFEPREQSTRGSRR